MFATYTAQADRSGVNHAIGSIEGVGCECFGIRHSIYAPLQYFLCHLVLVLEEPVKPTGFCVE